MEPFSPAYVGGGKASGVVTKIVFGQKESKVSIVSRVSATVHKSARFQQLKRLPAFGLLLRLGIAVVKGDDTRKRAIKATQYADGSEFDASLLPTAKEIRELYRRVRALEWSDEQLALEYGQLREQLSASRADKGVGRLEANGSESTIQLNRAEVESSSFSQTRSNDESLSLTFVSGSLSAKVRALDGNTVVIFDGDGLEDFDAVLRRSGREFATVSLAGLALGAAANNTDLDRLVSSVVPFLRRGGTFALEDGWEELTEISNVITTVSTHLPLHAVEIRFDPTAAVSTNGPQHAKAIVFRSVAK